MRLTILIYSNLIKHSSPEPVQKKTKSEKSDKNKSNGTATNNENNNNHNKRVVNVVNDEKNERDSSVNRKRSPIEKSSRRSRSRERDDKSREDKSRYDSSNNRRRSQSKNRSLNNHRSRSPNRDYSRDKYNRRGFNNYNKYKSYNNRRRSPIRRSRSIDRYRYKDRKSRSRSDNRRRRSKDGKVNKSRSRSLDYKKSPDRRSRRVERSKSYERKQKSSERKSRNEEKQQRIFSRASEESSRNKSRSPFTRRRSQEIRNRSPDAQVIQSKGKDSEQETSLQSIKSPSKPKEKSRRSASYSPEHVNKRSENLSRIKSDRSDKEFKQPNKNNFESFSNPYKKMDDYKRATTRSVERRSLTPDKSSYKRKQINSPGSSPDASKSKHDRSDRYKEQMKYKDVKPSEKSPKGRTLKPQPVVRLRSSSEEPDSDRDYDNVDEEKEKELRMLKLLKSDLAAKAKESLEKKIPKVPAFIQSKSPPHVKVTEQKERSLSPEIKKPIDANAFDIKVLNKMMDKPISIKMEAKKILHMEKIKDDEFDIKSYKDNKKMDNLEKDRNKMNVSVSRSKSRSKSKSISKDRKSRSRSSSKSSYRYLRITIFVNNNLY